MAEEYGAAADDEERSDAVDVRFQWTIEAVEQTARYVSGLVRNRRETIIRGAVLIIVALAIIVALMVIFPHYEHWQVLAIAAAAQSVSIATQALFVRGQQAMRRKLAEKDYRRVEWSTVTVGAEGVFLRNETRDEFLSWYGVKAIHDAEGLVYFEHGGLMGIAVPDGAFRNRQDREDFLAVAKGFYTRRGEHLPLSVNPAQTLEDMPRPSRLN